MNKEKLIQLLEQELVQADAATTDEAFHKHIYAIHTLTSLYVDEETPKFSKHKLSETNKNRHTSLSSEVTDEEIKMMGGKVSSSPQQLGSNQRMVTDDEVGNGASIFDF
ncbi:DUF5327 family protein [Staphylococcus coagulans]|uniref:DUF5327 family protein n=1 Tax=Staphylococcus coagulans TaxID=74706 RepID=UPI001F4C1EC9|nr:DUF5327 family protein [Staphylococcus coagulans]UNB45930.1 YwdI family protein [Staphylococcus coagulans]